MKRRNFLQKASLSTIGVVGSASVVACNADKEKNNSSSIINSTRVKPIVIATWNVPNATAKATSFFDPPKVCTNSREPLEMGMIELISLSVLEQLILIRIIKKSKTFLIGLITFSNNIKSSINITYNNVSTREIRVYIPYPIKRSIII